MALAINEVGKVPCNGCTRCCHGDAVRILPHEDVSRWATEPHPYQIGARMLAHKPNGDCVYLGDIGHGRQGCTIHATRPQVCREMDCRLIFERIPFAEAKALHATGRIRLEVWRKGQELTKECAS